MQNEFSLQVLSDIHLEFPLAFPSFWNNRVNKETADESDKFVLPIEKRFSKTANYIALLGDICTIQFKDRLKSFFAYIKSLDYYAVFYLPGNHEFYSKKNVVEVDAELESLCTECGVIYMNKKTFDVPGTDYRIVGCTLWTRIPAEQSHEPEMKGSSDFKMIHSNSHSPITFDEYNALHHDHVTFLEDQIDAAAKEQKKLIIFSHHKPTLKRGALPSAASSMFQCSEKTSSVFESDCDRLFMPPVVSWFYGHTHATELHGSLVVNDIPVFSNQVGYFVRGVPDWMNHNQYFNASWSWKPPL